MRQGKLHLAQFSCVVVRCPSGWRGDGADARSRCGVGHGLVRGCPLCSGVIFFARLDSLARVTVRVGQSASWFVPARVAARMKPTGGAGERELPLLRAFKLFPLGDGALGSPDRNVHIPPTLVAPSALPSTRASYGSALVAAAARAAAAAASVPPQAAPRNPTIPLSSPPVAAGIAPGARPSLPRPSPRPPLPPGSPALPGQGARGSQMTLADKAAVTKVMAENAAVRRAVARAQRYKDAVADAVAAASRTTASASGTVPSSPSAPAGPSLQPTTAPVAPAPAAVTVPPAPAAATVPPAPAVATAPPEPAAATVPPAPAAATVPPVPAVATVPPVPAVATVPPVPAAATVPPVPAAATGSPAPAAATGSPMLAGAAVPTALTGVTPAQTRGKGRSWCLAERTALAKAYAVPTLNGVAETDQSKSDFWEAVYQGYVAQCPPELTSYALAGRWRNRTPSAAMTVFLRNVGPCSQRFAHFYFVASSDKLTGNLDEESVKRAARALYSASSAYSAVCKDCVDEDKLEQMGKAAPQRRARMVPENWQPCWEELRVSDKWCSAAANSDITSPLAEENDDQTNGTGGGGVGAHAKKRPAPQGVLMGHKSAKKMAYERFKQDDEAFAKAMNQSNEAIMTIAASISKRAAAGEAAQEAENRRVAAEYFQQERVRETPEAKAFQADLHQEMLALGRAAIQSSRHRRTRGAPSVSSDVELVPMPSAPSASSTDEACGSNSFATKANRAMSQSRTIDLTLPPSALVVTEVGTSETEVDEEGGVGARDPMKGHSSDDDEVGTA